MTPAPGVALHTHATAQFKTNILCLSLRRPLDRATATGLALLPGVLEQGCARYATAARLQSRAEFLYGSVLRLGAVKKGEEHLLQCYLEVVDQPGLFEAGLELLEEVLTRPLVVEGGFNPEALGVEKGALASALAALGDNKAEYARLRCLEVLCPEEPYGVRGEGYAEDLAGITAKGLYGLYTEALAGAPAEWVLIGKPQAAAARLGDFFGRRAGAPPPPAQATRPRRPLQWVREAAEAAQGKICVALRAWRPVEFLPLLLFCEMLGGGSGSLLFTRARQRENLCYYIHASVCRQKSIVLVQSGVDPKNYEKILTATLQALESLQKNIPPAQLERAKGELSKQFLLLRDNPGGLIDFIVSQRLAGADAGPEEAAAQVRALGPEAVRQAAENLYVDTVYTLGG